MVFLILSGQILGNFAIRPWPLPYKYFIEFISHQSSYHESFYTIDPTIIIKQILFRLTVVTYVLTYSVIIRQIFQTVTRQAVYR
jgi:hypothetical protein